MKMIEAMLVSMKMIDDDWMLVKKLVEGIGTTGLASVRLVFDSRGNPTFG